MLLSQIIETGVPVLSLDDRAAVALQLMDDYDLQHLPVVAEEKYIGLVSKDDLNDLDDAAPVAAMQHSFSRAAVLPEEHLFTAVKLATTFELTVIPVVNKDNELQGVVTHKKLLYELAILLNIGEPGGIIVLEMDKRNFSFGELSRLIETNDAMIMQLNSYTENTTGLFIITIKLNKQSISGIIATLQRYDYAIRYYFGEEEFTNELRENYDLLMTYLKM